MRKRTNWAEWNEWLDANYALIPTRKIAEKIGCSMNAVKQQAFKRNLTKFPEDISFFETWGSESAYVIGLFAADGYAQVREGKGVVLSITLKDVEILEKIKAILGRGSLYYIRTYDTHRLDLYGRKLYEHMNKIFGHNVQRKSRTLQWPDLPAKFERDFIRGYCDGDGHIGRHREQSMVRFYSGSENFRDVLMERIEHRTGIQGTISTGINTVYLAIYTSIKGICLAQWLYQPGDLAMLRKVKAAKEMVDISQDRILQTSVTPKMREMFPGVLSRFNRETAEYLMSSEVATCSVEGCNRSVHGHGYCDMHYQRWKKHDDPMLIRENDHTPLKSVTKSRYEVVERVGQ